MSGVDLCGSKPNADTSTFDVIQHSTPDSDRHPDSDNGVLWEWSGSSAEHPVTDLTVSADSACCCNRCNAQALSTHPVTLEDLVGARIAERDSDD
jgi:hypothetical protein